MKRVAITGIGMIDTLGNNPQDCFSAFISDEYIDPVSYEWSVLDRYKEQKVFPVTSEIILPEIDRKTLKTFDRNIKYALHSVHQALQDANVPQSEEVAVVASNVTSGDEAFFEVIGNLHKLGKMTKIKEFISGMKDFLPGFITQQWGFHGPNVALNAACATGIFNIDYAMRLVDEHDYVVCALSDASVNPIHVPFAYDLGALGNLSNPFGENRNGFIPGDGGACMILESEEKAIERGAKIHAWAYPAGFGSDGYAATAPSPEGIGAKRAMRIAMKNTRTEELAFVNAHGTSTPLGDDVEAAAIKEVIGDVPFFSCKRKIGHTTGTAGMIEAIYGIGLIQNGVYNKKKFLNNSFGFGGKCASQVIEVNV